MAKDFSHLTELEIAWMSGLFEGEGYIDVKHRQISVKMTDEDVVRKLSNFWDAKVTPIKAANERCKPQYKVVSCWGSARNLLLLMYPHLGIRRLEKANEFLLLYVK